MASVDLIGIGKKFGATDVLRDVTLRVADGEFLAILGASGCGKSTLLRILAGLEGTDQGEVRLGGIEVGHLRPKARDLAMVFQSYALYPYMTVGQNIALPLEMRRLSAWQRLPLLGRLMPGTRAARENIAEDVASVAGPLQLGALLGRKPAQLSGGQRQRVALARAMVRQPAAFLMDEPLSNLDAKLRIEARAEIVALQRRLGATILYVTHDQEEAMAMADRVAVMQGGRVLQVAAPQSLYDDPVSLDVARFVGSPPMNVFPVRLHSSGAVEALGTALPFHATGTAREGIVMGVRPEALRPAEQGIAVTLARIERLGGEALLYCTAPGLAQPLVAQVEAGEANDHAIGAPLRLMPRRALLFDADGKRMVCRAGSVGAMALASAHG
nr:ABC transporter ATP-binding protein [uncultured Roseococcus sp.]